MFIGAIKWRSAMFRIASYPKICYAPSAYNAQKNGVVQ
jgi:hypothetical protein